MNDNAIFLYGPSGSGKSTAGKLLADNLCLPFHDLDLEIEAQSGCSIPEIFKQEGETGFRKREKDALQSITQSWPVGVVALGGGALLDSECRKIAEGTGDVLILSAAGSQLVHRLRADPNQRPLLAENLEEKLFELLHKREDHYRSFAFHLDTGNLAPAQTAREIQMMLGLFHLEKMGAYDIHVQPGGLDHIGEMMQVRGLKGPVALVCDSHTRDLYANLVQTALEKSGYNVACLPVPAGEQYKNIQTVTDL